LKAVKTFRQTIAVWGRLWPKEAQKKDRCAVLFSIFAAKARSVESTFSKSSFSKST